MPASQELRDSWTDWLSTFHWDHFATLTFAQPRTEASARRAFAKYVRSVRQFTYGDPVGYFVGYEHGTFGRLHLHALMRTTTPQPDLAAGGVPCARQALPDTLLWRLWYDSFGRAKVETYDPRRGAAGYVSKYVTKRLAFYDIDNMVPTARDLQTGTK